MSLTYRLTGIFVLLLALSVASLYATGAQPAGAEGPRPAGLTTGAPPPDQSGGWIPGLPSNIASNLCALFPDQFECICVGVSPDLCKDVATLDLKLVARGDTEQSGGWIPGLPSNIASNLCALFPDQFECICVGVSPDLCKDVAGGDASLCLLGSHAVVCAANETQLKTAMKLDPQTAARKLCSTFEALYIGCTIKSRS